MTRSTEHRSRSTRYLVPGVVVVTGHTNWLSTVTVALLLHKVALEAVFTVLLPLFSSDDAWRINPPRISSNSMAYDSAACTIRPRFVQYKSTIDMALHGIMRIHCCTIITQCALLRRNVCAARLPRTLKNSTTYAKYYHRVVPYPISCVAWSN